MNFMESGLRWLVEKRIETSSVPAVYSRGDESLDVRAVPCRTDANANDSLDLTVEANTLDFIIPAADLPFDPICGDRITARGKIYEVNNWTSNEYVGTVAWRWCEGCYEVARRIHVKCLGSEEYGYSG